MKHIQLLILSLSLFFLLSNCIVHANPCRSLFEYLGWNKLAGTKYKLSQMNRDAAIQIYRQIKEDLGQSIWQEFIEGSKKHARAIRKEYPNHYVIGLGRTSLGIIAAMEAESLSNASRVQAECAEGCYWSLYGLDSIGNRGVRHALPSHLALESRRVLLVRKLVEGASVRSVFQHFFKNSNRFYGNNRIDTYFIGDYYEFDGIPATVKDASYYSTISQVYGDPKKVDYGNESVVFQSWFDALAPVGVSSNENFRDTEKHLEPINPIYNLLVEEMQITE